MLADRAVIFVDGRYTLQVRDQVDLDVFTIESLIDNPPPDWLKDNLGKGVRLGFDPVAAHDRRGQGADGAAEKAGATLVPLDNNPIDAIWAGPARSRRSHRSRSIRSPLPANWPRTSWRGSPPPSPRTARPMPC